MSLSLIIHELATNAAKHGALSVDGGRLRVGWRQVDALHGELEWAEATIIPAIPPTTQGFGTTLIQRLSGGDLGGDAKIDYRPDGMRAAIRFKLRGATA